MNDTLENGKQQWSKKKSVFFFELCENQLEYSARVFFSMISIQKSNWSSFLAFIGSNIWVK